MKKLTVFAAMTMLVVILASCGKEDYKSFVGTWGVQHIDYYNIDYAGNPIEASIKSWDFIPGDMDNGIDLIFREDRTGEMRDRSRDTLYFNWNEETEVYDSIVPCPDTTMVTRFTYSYNPTDKLLFMNMQVAHPYIHELHVNFVDKDTFVYENEYDVDYVEKAVMVRYSTSTRGTKSVNPIKTHPKSLLSNY